MDLTVFKNIDASIVRFPTTVQDRIKFLQNDIVVPYVAPIHRMFIYMDNMRNGQLLINEERAAFFDLLTKFDPEKNKKDIEQISTYDNNGFYYKILNFEDNTLWKLTIAKFLIHPSIGLFFHHLKEKDIPLSIMRSLNYVCNANNAPHMVCNKYYKFIDALLPTMYSVEGGILLGGEDIDRLSQEVTKAQVVPKKDVYWTLKKEIDKIKESDFLVTEDFKRLIFTFPMFYMMYTGDETVLSMLLRNHPASKEMLELSPFPLFTIERKGQDYSFKPELQDLPVVPMRPWNPKEGDDWVIEHFFPLKYPEGQKAMRRAYNNAQWHFQSLQRHRSIWTGPKAPTTHQLQVMNILSQLLTNPLEIIPSYLDSDFSLCNLFLNLHRFRQTYWNHLTNTETAVVDLWGSPLLKKCDNETTWLSVAAYVESFEKDSTSKPFPIGVLDYYTKPRLISGESTQLPSLDPSSTHFLNSLELLSTIVDGHLSFPFGKERREYLLRRISLEKFFDPAYITQEVFDNIAVLASDDLSNALRQTKAPLHTSPLFFRFIAKARISSLLALFSNRSLLLKILYEKNEEFSLPKVIQALKEREEHQLALSKAVHEAKRVRKDLLIPTNVTSFLVTSNLVKHAIEVLVGKSPNHKSKGFVNSFWHKITARRERELKCLAFIASKLKEVLPDIYTGQGLNSLDVEIAESLFRKTTPPKLCNF